MKNIAKYRSKIVVLFFFIILSCSSNLVHVEKRETNILKKEKNIKLIFRQLNENDSLKIIQKSRVIVDRIIEDDRSYLIGYTTAELIENEKKIIIFINNDKIILETKYLKKYKYIDIFPKINGFYKIYISNINPFGYFKKT